MITPRLLLFHLFILIGVSQIKGQFFHALVGSHFHDNEEIFTSLHLDSHTFKNVNLLQGVLSLPQGETSYDALNNRYFCITNLGITIVDAPKGTILNTVVNTRLMKGIEYNPSTDALLGSYWNGSNEVFTSLDLSSFNFTDLGTLNGVTGLAQGVTTFDAVNNRYFCVTNLGITIIDALTGTILNTVVTNRTMKGIEYNPNTEALMGSYFNHNNSEIFTSLDLINFTFTDLEMIDGVSVQGATTFDADNNRYFCITNKGIVQIDALTGKTQHTIANPIRMKGIEYGVWIDTYISELLDTTVCSGTALLYRYRGMGLDSIQITWLLDDSVFATDSLALLSLYNHSDSLISYNFKRIITNNNTNRPDTTSITIHILPSLKVSFIAPDTLCSGEPIKLNALSQGGIENNYHFQWILNDSLIGESDTLNLSGLYTTPSRLTLVLSDGCSAPDDEHSHIFNLRPKLSLELEASSLCANPSTTLFALPTGGNPNNYSISWYDDSANSLGNALFIEVTPPPLKTKYKAKLSDGCSGDTVTAEIEIDRIPAILSFSVMPREGCEPLKVDFQVRTDYADSFSGILAISQTDSNTFPDLFDQEVVSTLELNAGHYRPTYTLISQLGCRASKQSDSVIIIHPKPTANFRFSPEFPDLENNLVKFQNLSINAVNYIWDIRPFGASTNFEPEYLYTDTGLYDVVLIAISDKHCKDTLAKQIFIRPNYRVFIPNMFSPNGDGINDLFQPSMQNFMEAELQIYNRWGALIFENQGTGGWDGTYRGTPVQEGTYVYKLNILNTFGERQQFIGTVRVVR